MKRRFMFSIVSIILTVLFIFTGCSDKPVNDENNEIVKEEVGNSADISANNDSDDEYDADMSFPQESEAYSEPSVTRSVDDNDEYNALANSSSDFSYEVVGDEIIITKYIGISSDVIIPSRIEGKLVTAIEKSSFQDLAGLQSVEVPSTVKAIGKYAFYNCVGLTSIVLKDGLEIIETAAFKDCTSLFDITLPSTLNEIQAKAFSNCKKIESIIIPDNLTSFGTPTDSYEGGAVFSGCESLKTVKLSESQTCIPIDSFNNCISLAEITIPDSVRTLEEGAFENCTSLKEVIIPGNVSEVNYPGLGSFPAGPFQGCTSIEKVIIEEGKLEVISYGMFNGCTALKEIEIPENIKEIGKFAFCGCESLIQVDLPSELVALNVDCFKECVKLNEINIPNTCVYIGDDAFYGCSNLISVKLPENVQSMSLNAFYGCALKEISLPNNVIYFYFCGYNELKHIEVKGMNTELDSGYMGASSFDGLTISAPSGSEAEVFANKYSFNFVAIN